VTFPGAGVWLIFGVALQKILQNPDHLKWFNRAMALLLVASIVPVVNDSIS
jgi:threonine/homoserine/homoserine lactone efflux protein